MKKKIIYGIICIIFIISIIITFTKGLNVGMEYGEGFTITFATNGKNVYTNDVTQIAKEVLGKDVIVQNIEYFNDSCVIKSKKEPTSDDLENLKNKINEKYGTDLKTEDFRESHYSNVRLISVLEPYIIPVGISIAVIMCYYAMRFKGAKQMVDLLKYEVIFEGLLYSIYAICRGKIDTYTMPIAVFLYAIVIIIYTLNQELKLSKFADDKQ